MWQAVHPRSIYLYPGLISILYWERILFPRQSDSVRSADTAFGASPKLLRKIGLHFSAFEFPRPGLTLLRDRERKNRSHAKGQFSRA